MRLIVSFTISLYFCVKKRKVIKMMSLIWRRIDNTDLKDKTKQNLFLILSFALCCLIGAAAWLVMGRVFLPDITALIEFVGYAGMCGGIFGGLIFLYRH